MKPRLKPIKPKRISDQVFEQLRELIFRGDLQAGSRIMTERELSEAFNVSRNSVREAINKLVVMGFLEQRQGQGTFVRTLDDTGLLPLVSVMEEDEASVVHLFEVRRGLECNAAAMAAQRADLKDIQAMEAKIVRLKEDIDRGGLGTEADVGFHMSIACGSHNPLQVYIMKNVLDILFKGTQDSLLRLYEDPANVGIIYQHHVDVFTAIRGRDSHGAYEAMRRHLNFVIGFIGDQDEIARNEPSIADLIKAD